MIKPVVAIVGRPNVGKSTFFNRCIGAKHAIVDDTPGVTRDRIYHETDWAGETFVLVDTGGIITHGGDQIAVEVYDQATLAMEEADVIVFMVDGKAGLHGADRDVANLLRRSKKPVILAVNKVDSPGEESNALEFFELGVGEPLTLSAMRGSGGVGDLLDKIAEIIKEKFGATPRKNNGRGNFWEEENELDEEAELDSTKFSITVVGRPNVGKSSIVNHLIGQKRSIVAREPGTTRDAIDTVIKHKGKEITLVDTAGIRRKSKVDYGVEAFAVVRALRALGRADVVVLVLDASQEISDQDQKIAGKIEDGGKPAVIVLNKWDLIEDRSSSAMNKIKASVREQLRTLGTCEVLFVSAMNKLRVEKILDAAQTALESSRKRIGTGLLNQIINESVALVPPPASKRGKRLKIYYATQVSMAPPTFVFFVNDGKLMPKNYQVYLERKIREAFGFAGTPIRLITRDKKESR